MFEDPLVRDYLPPIIVFVTLLVALGVSAHIRDPKPASFIFCHECCFSSTMGNRTIWTCVENKWNLPERVKAEGEDDYIR